VKLVKVLNLRVIEELFSMPQDDMQLTESKSQDGVGGCDDEEGERKPRGAELDAVLIYVFLSASTMPTILGLILYQSLLSRMYRDLVSRGHWRYRGPRPANRAILAVFELLFTHYTWFENPGWKCLT
jgi:hypothetical protein